MDFLRRLLSLPDSYWSYTMDNQCRVSAWLNTNPNRLNTGSSSSTKVSLKELFSHLKGHRFSDSLVLLWNLTVPGTCRAWELSVPAWPQQMGLQHIWFDQELSLKIQKWDGRTEDPQFTHTSALEISAFWLSEKATGCHCCSTDLPVNLNLLQVPTDKVLETTCKCLESRTEGCKKIWRSQILKGKFGRRYRDANGEKRQVLGKRTQMGERKKWASKGFSDHYRKTMLNKSMLRIPKRLFLRMKTWSERLSLLYFTFKSSARK